MLRVAACKRPGDAEVRHQRVPSGVSRMFSGLMSRCTTPCSWAYSSACAASRRDPERVVHRELPLAPEPVAQRLSPSTNGMVNQSWPAASPESSTVRMCGCCSRAASPDLALEPFGAERGGQLGVQDLERDRAVVPEVVGEEHRRHAAAPELALEPVPVCQAALELVTEVCHAGLS